MGISEWLLIALGSLIGAAIVWATLAIRSSFGDTDTFDVESKTVTVVYNKLEDLYPDFEDDQTLGNLEGVLAGALNQRFGVTEEE